AICVETSETFVSGRMAGGLILATDTLARLVTAPGCEDFTESAIAAIPSLTSPEFDETFVRTGDCQQSHANNAIVARADVQHTRLRVRFNRERLLYFGTGELSHSGEVSPTGSAASG